METGPSDPLVGKKLGDRYVVRRLVGTGAMGAVYEAEQVPMGRKVAVKVLLGGGEDDPAIVKRFFREAKAASLLSNPNTVVVHDFGRSADGTLYLVMEYLEGESLAARIERQGAIRPEEAAEIAAQVLRALVEAHKKDLVHRDLKPDNVFLTSGDDGRLLVKVLDFGIARMHEKSGKMEAGITQAGMIIGTPRYMAPEQARSESPGPPADLYSVGCMLFEMLSGVVPYDDDDPILLLGMHIRDPFPPIESMGVRRPAPAPLDGLVRHLLEKEPSKRPADAATVMKQLRAFLGTRASGPIRFDAATAVPQLAATLRAPPSTEPPPGPPSGELAYEPTQIAGPPTTRESPAVDLPTEAPVPKAPDTGSTAVLPVQSRRLGIRAIAGIAVIAVLATVAVIVFRVAGDGESRAEVGPQVAVAPLVQIRLAITPPTATVVRGGQVVGTGPDFVLGVPASSTSLVFEVVKEGYRTERVEWQPTQGLSRTVTLLPEGASPPETAQATPETTSPEPARPPRTSRPHRPRERPPRTASPFTKVR